MLQQEIGGIETVSLLLLVFKKYMEAVAIGIHCLKYAPVLLPFGRSFHSNFFIL